MKEIYLGIAQIIRLCNDRGEKASYETIIDALSKGDSSSLNPLELSIYHTYKKRYDTGKAQFEAYYQTS
jgi:hypothetical protein